MPHEKTPLFIRLPKQQAAALGRLADKTGRPKQHLVSELLAQRLTSPVLAVGRVEVAPVADATLDDVLTLDEAAAWFKLPADAVRSAAETGDLPGRRFGAEWRFSRLAMLEWLRHK